MFLFFYRTLLHLSLIQNSRHVVHILPQSALRIVFAAFLCTFVRVMGKDGGSPSSNLRAMVISSHVLCQTVKHVSLHAKHVSKVGFFFKALRFWVFLGVFDKFLDRFQKTDVCGGDGESNRPYEGRCFCKTSCKLALVDGHPPLQPLTFGTDRNSWVFTTLLDKMCQNHAHCIAHSGANCFLQYTFQHNLQLQHG